MIKILLTVVGLLGLLFALVEWGLSRLEESPRHRPAALRYGAVGLVAILTSFFTTAPPLGQTFAAQAIETSPAITEAHEIVRLSAPESLIKRIIDRSDQPSLEQIQQERVTLHTHRRSLAAKVLHYPANRLLYNQSDTLIGVAYQTLSAQWALIRTGRWTEAERTNSTTHLRSELQVWQEQLDCALQAKGGCKSVPDLTEADSFLRTWTRFMHPYLIELVRFETTDPQLTNRTAAEYTAVSQLLLEGQKAVAARELPTWAGPLRESTTYLLQVALETLQAEQAATETGGWSEAEQTQAYSVVQQAFWDYFQRQRCLSPTHNQGCSA